MKNFVGCILAINLFLFGFGLGQKKIFNYQQNIKGSVHNRTLFQFKSSKEVEEKINFKLWWLPSPASPPPMMLWGIPFPKIPKFPRPGSPPPPPEQF